ncbi:MAG: acetate--CoA ligase family protein [Microthrixaceae bacterium]|nr:acetate--CoA ligase family protein [Microthrixaceae bacterium]
MQVDTTTSDDIARGRDVIEAALDGVETGDSVMLDIHGQEALLSAFNVGMAERVVVADVDEAVAAVDRIGWPVALKAERRDRRTRSAVSGVAIDLADEADLRRTWVRMAEAIRSGDAPDGGAAVHRARGGRSDHDPAYPIGHHHRSRSRWPRFGVGRPRARVPAVDARGHQVAGRLQRTGAPPSPIRWTVSL